MNTYLTEIVKRKEEEVKRFIDDLAHPLHAILLQTRVSDGRFAKALQGPEMAVIAEVKRKSPSLGDIKAVLDPIELASKYIRGGASAISVLTDLEGFGGTLEDLSVISHKYPQIPTLRKDFIVHPLQLAEAAFAGASAVLLIVAILGNEVERFMKEATRLGLETLVEVHNLQELEIALKAKCPIIGVNHRNLSTFQIDLGISELLSPLIPSHVITVAESGIHTPSQVKKMRDLGYNAALIGEALVRSEDPTSLIGLMKEVER